MYEIENSQSITGYPVKIFSRAAYNVVGFTRVFPPHQEHQVTRFWEELAGDGRLEKLRKVSRAHPWMLGLGSWDPECDPNGFRYTVCLEETPYTDFSRLEREYDLFHMEIGASEWMCFEMVENVYHKRFWEDNPYKMMGRLGYQFHTGDYSVGVHIEAYPPNFMRDRNADMQFWITVRCADRATRVEFRQDMLQVL